MLLKIYAEVLDTNRPAGSGQDMAGDKNKNNGKKEKVTDEVDVSDSKIQTEAESTKRKDD